MRKERSQGDAVLNEGMRYLENAIDILNSKAKREGEYYRDKKYVKMAGHTAYAGVLHALDASGIIKKAKSVRPNAKDYKAALAMHNRKMLGYFEECYEQLHLVAGYDGYGHKKHLSIAFEAAEHIIKWAANKAA